MGTTRKEKRIGIRISEELDDWLKRDSELEMRSISNYINYYIHTTLIQLRENKNLALQIERINLKKGRPVNLSIRVDEQMEKELQELSFIKDGKMSLSDFLCRVLELHKKNKPL